jgi:hypothetical protein
MMLRALARTLAVIPPRRRASHQPYQHESEMGSLLWRYGDITKSNIDQQAFFVSAKSSASRN